VDLESQELFPLKISVGKTNEFKHGKVAPARSAHFNGVANTNF